MPQPTEYGFHAADHERRNLHPAVAGRLESAKRPRSRRSRACAVLAALGLCLMLGGCVGIFANNHGAVIGTGIRLPTF